MDLTQLKIGDKIRLTVGHSATVVDLSEVPKHVGVYSCNNPARGMIWWPANCVVSCAEAEERAKLAKNILPKLPTPSRFAAVPVTIPAAPSRFAPALV